MALCEADIFDVSPELGQRQAETNRMGKESRLRSRFHPVVYLLYYITAFAVMYVVMHPVLLAVLFGILLARGCLDKGFAATVKALAWKLTLGLFCVIINILINHRGPTELFVINDTRFTLEALLFGTQMALVIIVSIMMFESFSDRMNEIAVISILAPVFPRTACIFGMLLGMTPQIRRDIYEINGIHGRKLSSLKMLFSMALESGIIRSISMRDRGYIPDAGKKRTNFFTRRLKKNDAFAFFCIAVFMFFIILFGYLDGIRAYYFPVIYISGIKWYGMCLWIIFYSAPILIRFEESIRWHLSRRGITDTDMQDQMMM